MQVLDNFEENEIHLKTHFPSNQIVLPPIYVQKHVNRLLKFELSHFLLGNTKN